MLVRENDLTDRVDNIILSLERIEIYLGKANYEPAKKLYQIEQKLKTLQKKIPNKKKLHKSLNNKDLENIIEDIIEGLDDIDDSIEGGIGYISEAVNDNISKEKQPVLIKLFLALIPVYLRWKKLESDYHKKTYKAVDAAINTGDPNAAEKAKIESRAYKPEYKDLIPIFILSIIANYSVGQYKSLFSSILSKFPV